MMQLTAGASGSLEGIARIAESARVQLMRSGVRMAVRICARWTWRGLGERRRERSAEAVEVQPASCSRVGVERVERHFGTARLAALG